MRVKLATALMLLVTASAPEDKSPAQGQNIVSIRTNLIIKLPLNISIKHSIFLAPCLLHYDTSA